MFDLIMTGKSSLAVMGLLFSGIGALMGKGVLPGNDRTDAGMVSGFYEAYEIYEAHEADEVSENREAEADLAPEMIEADWTAYFGGLNGAAVVYDVSKNRYTVFCPKLAQTRRPPCSTFKIISSLTALENGVIEPEESVRAWSGEMFWNEDWNRDIDFYEAFRTSCVWYFREVIDDIGKEKMQEALYELQYGNCDISDWEGRLNTNNSNRALTGFWIESSLAISPMEQANVMEQIFGDGSVIRKKRERR